MALLCDVIGGEVLLECGDEAAARRYVHEGVVHLAALPDAGILHGRLQALKERVEKRLLVEPLTRAEQRVLELLPTELNQREIAERLFVSRETARTHPGHLSQAEGAWAERWRSRRRERWGCSEMREH